MPEASIPFHLNALSIVLEDGLVALVHTPDFGLWAYHNVTHKMGCERYMYPFLNVILLDRCRTAFGSMIVKGVGSGQAMDKQPDCVLILAEGDRTIIAALDIKGPSTNRPYVTKGVIADLTKLKALVDGGVISLGIAAGIYLNPQDRLGCIEICHDNLKMHVKLEVKTVQ